VHLHHLGHPVVGDALYGKKGNAPRQMLHAWKLGFIHPRTGKPMQFEAPIPEDFQAMIASSEQSGVEGFRGGSFKLILRDPSSALGMTG
jgi:23S rRNA pseudouridine1911/1915/1917 synthase